MDGFVSIESPLTCLTLKNMIFEWSVSCRRGFNILNKQLTSILVFTLPEGTKGFVVYCDSSRVGLGSILMQHGKVVA